MEERAILVGRAVPADAPAILGIHRRVLEEGCWFITEPDEFSEGIDVKVGAIREAARGETSLFLVARLGHVVVGWAQVVTAPRRRVRHVGRLEVMVDARARGRGVGDALLAGVITWGEANPTLTKLSLNVFAHNDRAIALYLRHGFFEEGRREREYHFPDGSWRADVLMARWVKPLR
jgi:ribosomal protein S18 acetylase RimI-like enzyme